MGNCCFSRRLILFFSLFCIVFSTSQTLGIGDPKGEPNVESNTLEHFSASLDHLRKVLKIPGMSAGILKNQQLIWARGYGYADVGKKIKITKDTPMDIASVAKTFASTIIMQLREEGKLDLEDPLSKYGIQYKSKGKVKVKHILSHTSEYYPGKYFRYSGRLFGHLDPVIRIASGKTYKELVIEHILQPLKMTNSAPNKESEDEDYPYEHVYHKVAAPYYLDNNYQLKKSRYRYGFFVAGGLIVSVVDLAKYDAALDQNILMTEESKNLAFTPTVSIDGQQLPYGLGWFSQYVNNVLLVWHYGWDPGCASALMIKVPEKNMTFIIFANSDKLSQPFGLRHGNVLNSPAALLFLKSFIFIDRPVKDLHKREVMAKKISEYASGRKPVLTLIEKGILACCLLLFLSPLVVWPGAFIYRIFSSKKGIRPKAPSKGSIFPFFSHIYALAPVGLSILFYGALFQAPFLIYWQDLPGLVDGIL
jgi:CubicO group peptidase (beta-lactamase class C family)